MMMKEIKLDYAQQPTGTSLSAAILVLDLIQGKVEKENFSKKDMLLQQYEFLCYFPDTT